MTSNPFDISGQINELRDKLDRYPSDVLLDESLAHLLATYRLLGRAIEAWNCYTHCSGRTRLDDEILSVYSEMDGTQELVRLILKRDFGIDCYDE